jgi:hypothetical protein
MRQPQPKGLQLKPVPVEASRAPAFESGPLPRRRFVATVLGGGLTAAAYLSCRGLLAAETPSPELVVDDPDGALGRAQAPVAAACALDERQLRAAREGRLGLRERRDGAGASRDRIPVQLLPDPPAAAVRLCWLLPAGAKGRRVFTLEEATTAPEVVLRAQRDPASSQYDLVEGGQPVLRYNYATVGPGAVLESIAPANRQYAVPRSDYIHPLYGPHGETFTQDWSADHPHHRGIYWAWPEVDWRGRRGDLHALQRVCARPTGQCIGVGGPVFAQVEAENLWKWEDRDAIVRERALLRAWRATPLGRVVDLEFRFRALGEPVELARRDTRAYGGLNLRFSSVAGQQIATHTAPWSGPPARGLGETPASQEARAGGTAITPAGARPRMAWGQISGCFDGAAQPASVVILQHSANPGYPGDWVEYPALNWLQPTFPARETRHRLERDVELTLRYRLWIRAGAPAEDEACADQWRAFHAPLSPPSPPR